MNARRRVITIPAHHRPHIRIFHLIFAAVKIMTTSMSPGMYYYFKRQLYA